MAAAALRPLRDLVPRRPGLAEGRLRVLAEVRPQDLVEDRPRALAEALLRDMEVDLPREANIPLECSRRQVEDAEGLLQDGDRSSDKKQVRLKFNFRLSLYTGMYATTSLVSKHVAHWTQSDGITFFWHFVQ